MTNRERPAASVPAVTVIALCYNHARFLHECLDSIAAQTVRDFQLIVTDDCSRDGSAELIADWLAEHRPDAHFIRHQRNAGLCRTLNEALALARGEFISMIATDDAWEPDKLERQLDAMRRQDADVAVVYSDAKRMDETGRLLEPDFIAAHVPECTRPSGRVFAELANRNFIPAMATLVRRSALLEVGGYDERLTYEDYDMWLRLAARHRFVYCAGTPARYRIVDTSIVRTVFFHPTPQHHFTLYLICRKWLPSGLLSPAQRAAWAERLWGSAYWLYRLDDPRATGCLWQAARFTRKPRALVLALASSFGLSRSVAKRLAGIFR